VQTKAGSVTNLVELSRFRGALASTWLLNGTVLKVLRSKGKRGRNRTDLRTKHVWLGERRRRKFATFHTNFNRLCAKRDTRPGHKK